MYNEDSTIMIGHEIMSWKATDGNKIVFRTTRGGTRYSITLEVLGDCCSTSIIWGVDGDELQGPVIKVTEDYKNTRSEEDIKEDSTLVSVLRYFFDTHSFDVLSIWDIILEDDKGNQMRIKHANESNGYYDGMVYCSEKEGWE